MKNLVRVVAATAVLALATPAYGQGYGGGGGMQMSPEQMIARQKDRMFEGITLSAEQSAKADTIIMKGMRQLMEMRQSGGMDREAMQKMNTERNDALKALLNDEQKKKFEANLAAMPQGRRGGGAR
jgi:Spy/CpxP family protein refolding chaperone